MQINEIMENEFNRDSSWPTATYSSTGWLRSQEKLIDMKLVQDEWNKKEDRRKKDL